MMKRAVWLEAHSLAWMFPSIHTAFFVVFSTGKPICTQQRMLRAKSNANTQAPHRFSPPCTHFLLPVWRCANRGHHTREKKGETPPCSVNTPTSLAAQKNENLEALKGLAFMRDAQANEFGDFRVVELDGSHVPGGVGDKQGLLHHLGVRAVVPEAVSGLLQSTDLRGVRVG